MIKLNPLPILYLILLTGFSSCSYLQAINPFFSEETGPNVEVSPTEQSLVQNETQPSAPPDPTLSKVVQGPREIREKRRESSESFLEIIWQAPAESVEKYHLSFGLTPDDMSGHLEIPIADLEKFDHPKYGPVYLYRLKNLPRDKAVYISLAAENKFGKSDPTQPTRVEPGTRSVAP